MLEAVTMRPGEIEPRNRRWKKCVTLLDSKSPIQGPWRESEEKHEPVSDIDTVVVDSLKALDPEWPIREADVDQVLCLTNHAARHSVTLWVTATVSVGVRGGAVVE